MTTTAKQVIDRVREELGDELPPFRFGSPRLLQCIRDAENEMSQKWPHTLYVADEIVTALPDPHLPGIGSTLSVRDRYATAVVFYVCYRAVGVDSEHAANVQLSDRYKAQFMILMV